MSQALVNPTATTGISAGVTANVTHDVTAATHPIGQTLAGSANTPSADALKTRQLGQIAVDMPGATAVFRRLKLDFCCGGNVSLASACAQKDLNADAVAAELLTLDRRAAAPEADAPDALIDHILTRYHEVHRQQLPELIRMARRVEAVHGDRPDCPAGLVELLEIMQAELLDHMSKEEAILFPMLRQGGAPFARGPIAVMRMEHNGHGEQVARLLALTHDATPPAGACTTWRALYAGIEQLVNDLMEHIHLENNRLFVQFERPH